MHCNLYTSYLYAYVVLLNILEKNRELAIHYTYMCTIHVRVLGPSKSYVKEAVGCMV